MNGLLIVVCAALAIGGVVTVFASFIRTAEQTRHRATRTLPAVSRKTLGAVAAGALLALVTRWLPWLLIVPGAIVVLPKLLKTHKNPDIALLEALDRWVRSVTAALLTGKSIQDAIRATHAQCPPLLVEPMTVMLARLNQRWTFREAMLAMADEVDSADADAVFAALILSAERGGLGASRTMNALAESITDRLRALREVEAERAKPRAVVRQVTAITLVVLGAALAFNRSYFAPMGTVVGQIIAVFLIAAYLGSLAMLQRMSIPRTRERLIGTSSHG